MIIITAATEEDIPLILEIEHEAISPPWTAGALLNEIYRDDSFFAVARFKSGIRNSEFGIEEEYTAQSAVFAPELKADSVKWKSSERERGGVLGFVILRRIADEGELLQIAVEKTVRRRGIADALMGAALVFAEKCALRSVFLEVRKSNVAAAELYNKHGYKTVRQRRDYYSSPLEDAVVMIKEF